MRETIMIKAAFFDIDGTILDHTGDKSIFHDSTAAALAALQRKGIKVFISTGRGPALLGEIWDMFPFDGFVTFNGQLMLERDGTVLHRLVHSTEDVRAIVELCRKEGLPGMVMGERESWPLMDAPQVRGLYKWLGQEFPPLYDPEQAKEKPVIQLTLYESQETAGRALSPVKGAEVVSCGPGMVDVIPKGGGKEAGLNAVISHYGFKREETAAFGDGMNDLRMIEWAGTGVAMGNAEPEVKAVADYVTTPVWADGVKNALLHLGILTDEDFK